MNNDKILNRMNALNDSLKAHSVLYYKENSPTIQDHVWDELLQELKSLETQYPDFILEDSVTQTVGYNPHGDFKTKVHSSKMLSLGNIFDETGLDKFISRVEAHVTDADSVIEYTVEPKYDGVAIAVIYKGGKLVSAITRGNGFEGEDVTTEMYKVENLPETLPRSLGDGTLELRGEVVMSRDTFGHYNDIAGSLGLPELATCRNAAAGTLRHKELDTVAPRPLQFIVYRVVQGLPHDIHTQQLSLEWISKHGFQASSTSLYKDAASINAAYLLEHSKRSISKFDIDGVVIKVNDLKLQDAISTTSREPKWAIAYKFPAEMAATKILKVEWQLSRLGQLTPIAHLAEINLNGVNISSVSLQNTTEIDRLDLHIGDTVNVIRSGDVIPKITTVVKRLRPSNATRIHPPKYCPSCDSEIIFIEDDPNIYCGNVHHCKDILSAVFLHFTSKEAMDIKGFGEKIVEALVEEGYLKRFFDLYYLYRHKKQLSTLPGLGVRSVENVLEAIDQSKTRPLSKVIYGLGIPYVGVKTAQTLADRFVTMEQLRDARPEDFANLPGVGAGVVDAVIDFLNDSTRKIELDGLAMAGLKPTKG